MIALAPGIALIALALYFLPDLNWFISLLTLSLGIMLIGKAVL